MRRFIGLLMLFVILFPLLMGAGAVFVTRQVVIGVQAEYELRMASINRNLAEIDQTLRRAQVQFETLQTVADQIFGSATQWARDVIDTINNFQIRYGGFQWPSWVQDALRFIGLHLPDIPAVNFTIPGLSAVRDFLRNIFDSLAQLSSALSDIAQIAQVPAQLNAIYGEMQSFYGSLNAIIAPYGTLVIVGIVGGFIWFAAVYLVLAYTWILRGWALLTGRSVTV
jgi:hypothetical protein